MVKDNKKYRQFFWRSWAIQASWNYERQMNMGFLYGISPTLERIYSKPEDLERKKKPINDIWHTIIVLLRQVHLR